jgi:hypothetical protein
LFLLPGVFLGTISPYVIRLAVTKLNTVGSTAGTLYAVSTAGSIFGTLLTAFYLIPVLGVSNIIHSLGVTLVVLSLIVVPLMRFQRAAIARIVTAGWLLLGSFGCFSLASTPQAWAKTLLQKDMKKRATCISIARCRAP